MATVQVSDSLRPKVTDTPLDERSVIATEKDYTKITLPFVGLLFYVKDTKKVFKVTELDVNERLITKYEEVCNGGGLTIKDGALQDNKGNRYTINPVISKITLTAAGQTTIYSPDAKGVSSQNNVTTIIANVQPAGAKYTPLDWTVSDNDKAVITGQDGNKITIEAKSAGKVTITCKARDVDEKSGTIEITVVQRASVGYSSWSYNNPVVGLSYADISADGGYVDPTLTYSQTKTRTQNYNDGSSTPESEAVEVESPTVGYVRTSGTGIVSSTGRVTFTTRNTSKTSKVTVANVSVSVTANGKTGTANAIVYQEKFVTSVYLGHLPSKISGFTSKATSLVASITPTMLSTAISQGYIEKSASPISAANAKRVVTTDGFGFFIGLVPDDKSYAVTQYDGINNYVAFSASAGQYSNGETKLTIEGVTYKLYSQYASERGTDFQVKVE